MNTKVKNTLFRFVTMRTPELLEQEQVNQYFVKHPEAELESFIDSTSVFLNSISQLDTNQSRKNVLNTSSTSFVENSLKKKEETVSNGLVHSRMYDFAIWLSKNRTTFSIERLNEQLANPILGIPNPNANQWREISNENLIILWDNLFYQIITGKSAYVRDAILSILVAEFFLRQMPLLGNDLNSLRKLAQARVIIPKILFEKEKVTNKSQALKQAVASLPIQTKELDKELAVILAKEKVKKIQSQIAEFEKAKKEYNKTSQKAYEVAKKEYDETVANLFATADTVDSTITDPNTGVQRTVKEYVNLVLPKFEFEKPVELDVAVLSSKLSIETNALLSYLIQNENTDSFDEVLQFLEKQLEELSAFIIENTSIQQKAIVTNGIVIPLNETPITKTFAIAGLGMSGNQPLQLLFNDSEGNADIVQASYKIVFDDTTEISGTNFIDTIINNKLHVKIFTQGISLFDKSTFTISGSFTKSTGEKINFTGTCFVSEYNSGGSDEIIIYNRIADGTTTYTVKGNGTYMLEVIDLEEDNSETSDSHSTGAIIEPYIPSGFGIKRLGIADYRKVEQEVCCYVPGEVSHIENVMAREYKEKSTRRLRRSEDTTTTTKEQEIEKLTDTTSTDRFEMNQEVSNVLSEQTSMGAHANVHWGSGNSFGASVDADFATNTSSEESNSQAVTHAKEVTERALERVVQKVKEERISKIIEEFEENNKHGFDNTKGDKHVSGVYRWVDKIYKNKVINYGKRLMYEFMLPKPAHFHDLALNKNEKTTTGEIIEKPIDPRKLGFVDCSTINANNYNLLASAYRAEVEVYPKQSIIVSKPFEYSGQLDTIKTMSEEVVIPEKYKTKSVQYLYSAYSSPETNDNRWKHILIHVGDFSKNIFHNTVQPITEKAFFSLQEYTNKIPVSVSFTNYYVGHVIINLKCELTEEAIKDWQVATYNAIMNAYEKRLAEYNSKVSEVTKGKNSLMYREIENTVLRKNCIEYLASHAAVGEKSLLLNPTSVKEFSVDYDNPELETYAAKVKFFEQAFEWNLMSYFFYPFYWAEKDSWEELYNINDIDDPTFRAFLRSGMARVVLTVRPGFEEAVNWYMATGQIWNGGQVPTMDDELFVSIIEELREPEGEVEETWESRVPTSLTVIQAGSIGLNAEGLPCNTDCNDNLLFDSDGNPVFDAAGNPIKVIDQTNTVLGGNTTDTGTGNEGEGGGGPGQEPIEEPVIQ